jgi:hypothetical protein
MGTLRRPLNLVSVQSYRDMTRQASNMGMVFTLRSRAVTNSRL